MAKGAMDIAVSSQDPPSGGRRESKNGNGKGRAHRGARGRHHPAKRLSAMTVEERLAAEVAAAAAAARAPVAAHYPRVRRAPDQSLREDAGAFRPAPPLYRRDASGARQLSSRASPSPAAAAAAAAAASSPLVTGPPDATVIWRRRGANLDDVFDGGESSARALATSEGSGAVGSAAPLPPALAALPLSALCSVAGIRAQLATLGHDRLIDLLLQASATLAAAESKAAAVIAPSSLPSSAAAAPSSSASLAAVAPAVADGGGGAPAAKRARRGSSERHWQAPI